MRPQRCGKSAGTDKRKCRDRNAAVALANTPGIVEELINAMLKKGKGEGRCRGQSPGKGQGMGNGSRGNLAAAEEQVHMESKLLVLQ